jgi:cytochrome c553
MKRGVLPARWAAAMLLLSGAANAAAPAEDAMRARTNFIHYCSGCHLADGSGAPSKGIPSMRDTLGQFLKVTGGREFIVQVPGVMNSPLNDRDIAGLMNWLVPYASPATVPPDVAPYTAAEITRLRKSRPINVFATRQHLVAEMRNAGITIEAEPHR